MKTNKQLIYTLAFAEIGLQDISRVGGKNASLGELFNAIKPQGVGVIDGFATTADAYRALLAQGQLEYELRSLLSDFDPEDVEELHRRGHTGRVAFAIEEIGSEPCFSSVERWPRRATSE